MSSDRDITRIVRSWLEDGRNALPDRVLDSVLDQLPTTPQRRHSWQAWRNPIVSNTFKFMLAGAASLAVAAIGIGLYFNQPGGIGPPAASPSPTVAPTLPPTPEPTPAAALPLPDDDLEPGTYMVDSPNFPVRITFDVPDGWSGAPGTKAASVWKSTAAAPDYSLMVAFWIVDSVSADPCGTDEMDWRVGPTVDDLATAIAGWPGFSVSGPTDVALGGYQGKLLEITVPDVAEGCVGGDFDMWHSGGTIRGANEGNQSQLWILDVDGVRLVVETVDFPGSSDQDRAESLQILESIQIEKP
jgi:hypothetical protein